MLRLALATLVITCVVTFEFSRATPNDTAASRLLKVEQDVLSLKQLSSSQEKKYAALLSNILARLSSNSGDVINLRTELKALRDQHNSTVSELNTVRGELFKASSDLSRLQTQHQTCMTGLDDLRQRMNQTKDSTDASLLRLQENYNSTAQDLKSFKTGVNASFISILISTVNNISNERLRKFKTELLEMEISVNVTKSDLQRVTSDLAKNTVSIRNFQSLTTNLTTDVTQLAADVSESKCQLKKLSSSLRRVESDSKNSSSQITGLQKTVTRVNKQLSLQERGVTSNSGRISRLNCRLMSANSKIVQVSKATKELLHTNVYFTLSQKNDLHLHSGETLKFDNLINETGSGYNSTTGKFEAPVTGIYIFYVDFTIKVPTNDMYVDIMKHHDVIASVFVYSTNSHEQTNHGSVFTVIHLIRGQRVWFVVRKGNNAVILGRNLSRYGGALLHVG